MSVFSMFGWGFLFAWFFYHGVVEASKFERGRWEILFQIAREVEKYLETWLICLKKFY